MEKFYKYPYKLIEADGYISPKTGDKVPLSYGDKHIYLVMKTRNSFFDKHFDKQEDIAKLTAMSVKQVGRSLRDFIDNGVIVGNKGSSGQHKNWRYDSVADLQLYCEDGGAVVIIGVIEPTFWKASDEPRKKVTHFTEKKKSVQPTIQNNIDPDFDDLPF